MAFPETIDEVLAQLDTIISQTKTNASRAGYFAILYREVTAGVKLAIEEDFFEDGSRMEKLDVRLANRYLGAFVQYQAGENPGRSWLIAFDATKRTDLLILQHLFLGMNAHINLDLGIAAATVAPGKEIKALRKDFFRINTILFSLIDTIQDRLSRISPLYGWLDTFGGIKDERFADFSMARARGQAWNLANLLAPLPDENRPLVIQTTDKVVAGLATLITKPKLRLNRWVLRWMLSLEPDDIGGNMDRLA